MLSMTGYGKGLAERENIAVTVELKAVNHRFLDLSFKLPKAYVNYSEPMRRIIGASVKRGHIDVFLEVKDTREGRFSVELNKDLASAYLNAGRQLAELGVTYDLTASALLKLPEMVTINQVEKDEETLLECVTEACGKAVAELNRMRASEGEQLGAKIRQMLSQSKKYLGKIEQAAPNVVSIYSQKLETLLKEYTAGLDIDKSRLLTEVALFADRSSIDEEITRLKSHFTHLGKILRDGKEAGRQLDFLVQECNREINTIGSKCNSLDITKYVLLMKNEIEKIREQAQNVE